MEANRVPGSRHDAHHGRWQALVDSLVLGRDCQASNHRSLLLDFKTPTTNGGTGRGGMTGNAEPSTISRLEQNDNGTSFGPDCPLSKPATSHSVPVPVKVALAWTAAQRSRARQPLSIRAYEAHCALNRIHHDRRCPISSAVRVHLLMVALRAKKRRSLRRHSKVTRSRVRSIARQPLAR
jgi:hypothetical protein